MKTFDITFKYAGVLLCIMLLLVACSKKGDGPDPEEPEKTQLLLEASATDIDEGDEVDFTITADGKAVDADIYVGDTKISGTKHKFTKTGVYQVTAKKEGYTDSGAEEVKVYQVDVYVAGKATMAGTEVATYWKNGTLKTLSKPSEGKAGARSIFVDQGDVYVAGFQLKTSGSVTYWKNGTAIDLTDGDRYLAYAQSIFVDNGDGYVAGYQYNGSRYVAKYWKNGTATELSDGSQDAYAASVFVDEGNVHVAGFVLYKGSKWMAKYWKNGTATDLTDGGQNARANSIFVDQGDVYVAGYENKGSKEVAKYWKNGTATDLTDGSQHAWAESIFVDNGDVYVAGYEHNGSNFVAKYWNLPAGEAGNGTATDLTDGSQDGRANSIFVVNGKVYAAGYEDNGSKEVAKYWTLPAGEAGNGKAVALDDGDLGADGRAYSIFVTRSLEEK